MVGRGLLAVHFTGDSQGSGYLTYVLDKCTAPECIAAPAAYCLLGQKAELQKHTAGNSTWLLPAATSVIAQLSC